MSVKVQVLDEKGLPVFCTVAAVRTVDQTILSLTDTDNEGVVHITENGTWYPRPMVTPAFKKRIRILILNDQNAPCYDYVVSCDGGGTHDTVRDMMEDYLAAAAADTDVVKTCWICCDVDEDTNIQCGSSSSSVASGTLIIESAGALHGPGASGQRATLRGIIGSTNDGYFKTTLNYMPHFVFKNLKLETKTSAGSAPAVAHGWLYSSSGSGGMGGIDYYDCTFEVGTTANSNGIVTRMGDSTHGNTTMQVRYFRCGGSCGDLYQYRDGAIIGSLEVYDSKNLQVRHLVQNDDNSALQELILDGGKITCASYFFNHVTGSNLTIHIRGGIELDNNGGTTAFRTTSGQTASEPAALRFIVQGAYYTQSSTSSSVRFADLAASSSASDEDAIFIDNFFGRCDGSNAGALISITAAGWNLISLGHIGQQNFASTVTGATSGLDAHLADTSDAHDASAISILDAANDFTATDVEGALAELQSDAEAHLADAIDAHDASAISIVDSGGFFTGTEVEAALQELGTALAAHLADTLDAHDASAISIVDVGGYFTATDVEGALQELGAGGGGGGGHTIRENGVDQTARTGLNFVDTDAGATLVVDDAGNNETEITLSLYALLTGRSGGQTLRGGTASGDDLTLESTSNATKGHILLERVLRITAESSDTQLLMSKTGTGNQQFRYEFPDITTEDAEVRMFRTTLTTGAVSLNVLLGDNTNTSIFRASKSAAGVISLFGAGYLRIGSPLAPTNAGVGDATFVRLIVPNATLADSDLISFLGGPIGIANNGVLRFYDSGSANYIGIRAPTTNQTEQYIIILPSDDPATNDIVKVTGVSGADVTTEFGRINDEEIVTTNMKQALILSAASGYPTTTSGASFPGRVEFGTNDRDVFVIDFDPTTQEFAFWQVQMPDNWDGGTVTAVFHWITASSTSTHTVVWGIAGVASDDASGSMDQAYGTAVEVSDDASSTASAMRISAATAAITIAGSPTGGDMVTFRVYRDPADGNDDLSSDARLLGVVIEYGVSALSA